jgi:hypothetical protein
MVTTKNDFSLANKKWKYVKNDEYLKRQGKPHNDEYLKRQGKLLMTVYFEFYIDLPTLHPLYVYSFVRGLIRTFLAGRIDQFKANPSNKGVRKDGTNKYKARNDSSLPWVDLIGHFLPELKTFQS